MRVLASLLLLLNICYGDITGTVYQDGNGNGVFEIDEPQIGGVTINAYDSDGNLCDSNISQPNISPNYILDGCVGNVRLEFIIPETTTCGLQASLDNHTAFGSGSQSSIQFTTAGTDNNDFGILSPNFYVKDNNPMMFVDGYVNGNGKQGTTSDMPVMGSFRYNSSGIPISDGGTAPDPIPIVYAHQVGSIWGIAYSKTAKRLFMSAFLRRHMGMGPDGSGAIYIIDPDNPPSTGTIPSFIDLDALGYPTSGTGTYVAVHPGFSPIIGSNDDRQLPDDKGDMNKDTSAFGQVGKVSLGDIDLSDDGQYLYVVNLFDRKLYQIDLKDGENPVQPTSSDIKAYNTPWLDSSNCSNGVARAFGIKYYREKVYVGVVCTGENGTYPGGLNRYADDLRAYVYEIDPAGDGSDAEIKIEFPLNYDKESTGNKDGTPTHGWYNWSDDFADMKNPYYKQIDNTVSRPEPILGDIEIDSDGSLILSFLDRASFQMGLRNMDPDGGTGYYSSGYNYITGGDILKTYLNPDTCKYELEANGKVGPYTSSSADPVKDDDSGVWNNTGPSTHNGEGTSFTGYYQSGDSGDLVGNDQVGAGKEFYWGEYVNIDNEDALYPTPKHGEGIMGGLAILPSSGEVMGVGMDPVDNKLFSAGVYSLDNSNGGKNNAYNIYTEQGSRDTGRFGKAAGLGDVEIVGDIPPIEVGNRVWLDSDGDGIQDAGEVGIANVQVELYDPSYDTIIATATTDSYGNYIFSTNDGNDTESFKYNLNLEELKNYEIRIPNAEGISQQTALSGYRVTSQNSDASDNGDERDSDGTQGDNSVISFTLGEFGQNNHSYDIGFMDNTYCLGDRIWLDNNKNGIQDSGEENVTESVTVELLDENDNTAQDANGDTVSAITTDSGSYKFCNLLPDIYKVKITPPDDYNITIKDSAGTDDTNDSDIDVTTKESDLVDLQDDNMTIDIGLYKVDKTYCLGDYIWYDDNNNGIQDSGEAGVQDINITLNETGATTTTDSDGKYQFCGLSNGDYSITIDKDSLPSGYELTTQNAGTDDGLDSDINPSDGKSDTITINNGSDTTLDGGIYPLTYCIGDFIWYDDNNNGIQDSGEAGVQDINITLNETGATTTTDSDGKYQFCGLSNGDYSITIDKDSLPSGYELTTQNAGTDDGLDSDINPSDGKSDTITINNGSDTTLDGGIYPLTYCIGDFIWYDDNNNGIQDSGEAGVQDINITLNETGATTTTDSDGKYQFCGLSNGDYSITIDKDSLPSGYELTTQNAGTDDGLDSDINPSDGKSDTITINNGSDTTLDGGIYPLTYCIGDFIWYDDNNNGIQDSGEAGVQDINITLNETGATTTTDSDGKYQFCGLSNGDYSITIDKDSLPSGYELTTQNAGTDDGLDSDINPSDGKSDTITINNGSDTTLDGGIYPLTYCIGDFIWYDDNNNGIQDSGEAGVQDINITLNETGATTTTDSDGKYQFCGLSNGDYSITIDKDSLPSGYELTTQNAGTDDGLDSDINPSDGKSDTITINNGSDTTLDGGIYPLTYCLGDFIWYDDNNNGIQDSGEAGVQDINITLNETGATTTTDSDGKYQFCGLSNGDYSITIDKDSLPSGYELTTQNAGTDDGLDSDINPSDGKSDTITINNGSDTTLDGGIYPLTYCIGDFIWYDDNNNGIQDSGEAGVQDINITLNETGATTTTDSDGKYQFCGLSNGDYSITIDKDSLPSGYELTTQNAGTDDGLDSDINPSDGKSDTITINNGSDTTLDGGIYPLTYCIGDFIWYDDNNNGIQDSGEAGVQDINITLNETGATTTTDSDGKYQFCGLSNGDYSITIDKDSLPSGYELTTQNAGTDDGLDSDINPSDGKSDTITINNGSDTTLDVGISKLTYCLGDFVWYDKNENGIQDIGEEGVENIGITIYDGLDNKLNSTTTNDSGEYEFCNLDLGQYLIEVNKTSLPTDYVITAKDVENNDSADSDVDPSNGSTDIFTIYDNNKTIDIGIYKKTVTTTTTTTTTTYTPTPTYIPENSSEEEEPTPTFTPTPIPELEEEPEPQPLIDDETPPVLSVTDDVGEVNTEDSTTVVSVLENDMVDDGVIIKLVEISDGVQIEDENGVVNGTNLQTTDTIVVPGEGTWRVEGPNIIFIAEDGFSGTPTPIHYIVQDEYGNNSNIARVAIEGNCYCDTYESNSVPINALTILLLVLFNSILTLLSFKRRVKQLLATN